MIKDLTTVRENIPWGYQVHISSWENDLDSPATKVLSGLTWDDTVFIVRVLEVCHSRNSPMKIKGIGNGPLDGDEAAMFFDHVKELLDVAYRNGYKGSIIDKWREAFDLEVKDFDEAKDRGQEDDHVLCCHLYELLTELLDTPDCDMYRYDYTNFCRVAEHIEIYFIPHEIENVTKKFL